FEFAPNGYLVTDLMAVIQEANHAAAALLRSPKEFLVDKPLVFYVTERDQKVFAANLYRLTHQADSWLQWEMALRNPRAEPVYILVTAAPILADDQPRGIRWTLQDLTRRRQAEEQLRAQKEFADSLLDMAEAVIVLLDDAGRIV